MILENVGFFLLANNLTCEYERMFKRKQRFAYLSSDILLIIVANRYREEIVCLELKIEFKE